MSHPDPDVPLLRAVAVMDRLRSPGGCPWDAAQTPSSLAPYLLEETYELLEAIDGDDAALLREELGDLLLQVLFHARLAEERPDGERFGIDDVAADLVAKLVRRHPHVFADGRADTPGQVATAWDSIKRTEKHRESVTDGIPAAQPALALAAKLLSRTRRAGVDVALPSTEHLGGQLFALVDEAVRSGVDPEHELRRAANHYRTAVRRAEQAVSPARDTNRDIGP
ncbi:MAG: MazG family protein [bacterium]